MKRLLQINAICLCMTVLFLNELHAQKIKSAVSFIPEISLIGNNEEIPDGDTIPITKNNTHFGNVGLTQNKTEAFVIMNFGPSDLIVDTIFFDGVNANEFSLADIPTYPLTIAPNKAYPFEVVFTPTEGGTRLTTLNIINNDIDEGVYNVLLQGEATFTTNIQTSFDLKSNIKLFPNPANDVATIVIAGGPKDIHVFNSAGQEVMTLLKSAFVNDHFYLPTNELANGVYFLTSDSEKGVEKMKLLVSH